MYRFILLLALGLLASITSGQSILDQYVQEAIARNLSVKEKKLLEGKSRLSLQQANRMYGPDLRFLTSYTVAAGGRSIDFPIGTLLNDVYSTLNTLTGTQDFHLVEDQTVTFLPHNFYDTRFRITQPILQPEIKFNKLIRQEEVNMAGLATDQATRELIRNVKTAYLIWLQYREGLLIIEQGVTLLQENKRITESLIRNGLALPSALMRIESEITSVEAQRERAATDHINAAAYFNFLLQRAADSEIIADTFPGIPDIPVPSTLNQREELQQIQTGNKIQGLALSLEEKHFAPRLGFQVDAGSQAYVPEWGGYVLAGVQLEIPIWDNRQSKLKRQEWESGLASNEARYEWTRQAMETQLRSEINNLRADLLIYESYTASLASNQRYYNETLKRYKEGLSNYIELLDARTQVTQTQLQQNIAKYQSWIRQVDIERISASAILP